MAFATLITSHPTADQRAASSVITSICVGTSGELVYLCVQNVLEKVGNGHEELQRGCRSAGQASCLLQGLSYVQGCVYLLFSVKVQSVHALLPLLGQGVWSCTAA